MLILNFRSWVFQPVGLKAMLSPKLEVRCDAYRSRLAAMMADMEPDDVVLVDDTDDMEFERV